MKKISPGIRFLLGLVTFLLCVALFVTAFAGILVSNAVQIFSSQENLQTLLRQVMFVDLKHPADLRSVPGGTAPALRQAPARTLSPADIRFSDQQTAASMVEWIYNALAQDFGGQLQVDLPTVKEFVERSTLDDLLVEKGAGLINDIYTGENTVTLSPEEIQTKLEENAALIEEYFNVTVDAKVIADVTTVIEDNEYVARIEQEGIVNILLNPSGNGADSPDQSENTDAQKVQNILEKVRAVLSVKTLLICAGICLVLILLILLVNMKQIWAGMNAIGITLMVAALPFIALTVAVWVMPAGWAQKLGLYSIIEVLLSEMLTINAVICFGVFALGVVLLAAGIVTKSLARKKSEKAATLAAIEEAVIEEAPLPEVEFPAEEEAAEEEEEEEEETV